MSASNNYPYAGFFKLIKVQLNCKDNKTFDLTLQMMVLSITESFDFSCLQGYVDIADTMDLPYQLAFTGEETLDITYSDDADTNPSRTITQTFRCYTLPEREYSKSDSQTGYRLYFCSQEFFASELVKISKSYRNRTIANIVKDLYGYVGSKKKINIDPTLGNQHIIVPKRSCFEAIKWLTGFGISPSGNGAVFAFTESLKNGFLFVDIGNVFKKQPVGEKYRRFVNDSTDPNVNGRFAIQSLKFAKQYDALGGVSSGLYGSRIYAYDPLTKSYSTHNFDYASEFNNFPHTEDSASFKSSGMCSPTADMLGKPQAFMKFVATKDDRSDSAYLKKTTNVTSTGKREEKIISNRASQLAAMNQIVLEIETYGNTDLTLGEMIEIEIKTTKLIGDKTTPSVNEYLSGKYMISSITHKFQQSKYMCELQIVKDSFGKRIDPKKIGTVTAS